MITAEFNFTAWNRAFASVHDALLGSGQDVKNLLIDEHRRLVRTIINFTPPLPRGQAKQRGEMAVKKDLFSLISEARMETLTDVSNQYGLTNVDGYLTQRDGNKIHIQWDNLDPEMSRIEELHKRYRNSYGRVPRIKTAMGLWKSRVVVPTGGRDSYVKKVQARVGRWKAKWAYSAALKGDRYPTWLARHFGNLGGDAIAVFDLDNEKPGITFGVRNPGISRTVKQIQDALNFRAKAMARRAQLILSGYAKDISQGMRARANAHKHGEPLEVVD